MIHDIVKIVFEYCDKHSYAWDVYNKTLKDADTFPDYMEFDEYTVAYLLKSTKYKIKNLLNNYEIRLITSGNFITIMNFIKYTGLLVNVEKIHKNEYIYVCDYCYSTKFVRGFFNKMMCSNCSHTEQLKKNIQHPVYYINLKPQINLRQIDNIMRKL